LALTSYPEIEAGAILLCWRSNDAQGAAKVLEKYLPTLARPLFTLLPGPQAEVMATIPLFEELGFCLDHICLEMLLTQIPQVTMPPGIKSGQDLNFSALAALDLVHFPQHGQDQETLSSRALAPDWQVLCLEIERDLAEMAVGQVYGPSNSHLFILSLAVDAKFRRMGLGRKLMQGLFWWAKTQGAQKSMLWLGGGEKNPVARSLYESLGYYVRDCEAQLSLR
jgi:GNAT superfamily N-acetyltransferase